MDSLILIPDEHNIHATFTTAFGGPQTTFSTRPDGVLAAISYNTGVGKIAEVPQTDSRDWALPPGDGVIICAGTNYADDITGTRLFDITYDIYPSYASLRSDLVIT
jgi:hypothetical protein